MPFLGFSAATSLGAFLWCLLLALFGSHMIGKNPELLDSPEELIAVLHHHFLTFVIAILVLSILYVFVLYFPKKDFADSFLFFKKGRFFKKKKIFSD
jgi:membrane protein DedA with SNARE-associated domain